MRNKFTDKQREYLTTLSCVEKVTEYNITFTTEFKKAFLRRKRQGDSFEIILHDYGIKYHMLGVLRIKTMYSRWQKEESRPEGFERKANSSKGKKRKKEFKSIEEEMQYLKDEKDYYKRLSEWLKKPGGRKEPTRK